MSESNGLLTTLGEQIRTQKGYAFKSGWYCDIGRPIVKVSDFTQDSIDTSSLVCIPNEIAEKYLKYALGADDVVIQTVGSWPSNPQSVVGKAIRVPNEAAETLLNQNAVKLIPNATLDNSYLFYLLKTKTFRTFIVGTAQGAASQASITLDSLKAFPFTLPPLETQRQIAAILSAYDDLIENNSRRIKVLEEMAGLIYREWFVNFRFPGHEGVRRVASEFGEIPEGWEVEKLGRLTSVITKGTTPSAFIDEADEDGINYIKVQSIDSFGGFIKEKLAKIDHKTDGLLKRSRLQEQDILFSIAGAIGRAALVTDDILPANTNQALAIIRVKELSMVPYLYQVVRSATFANFNLARIVQTAQANVSLSVLSSAPILIPSD